MTKQTTIVVIGTLRVKWSELKKIVMQGIKKGHRNSGMVSKQDLSVYINLYFYLGIL